MSSSTFHINLTQILRMPNARLRMSLRMLRPLPMIAQTPVQTQHRPSILETSEAQGTRRSTDAARDHAHQKILLNQKRGWQHLHRRDLKHSERWRVGRGRAVGRDGGVGALLG